MASTAKVIATCLILAVSMQMCCGSAIPIWEFLTRNEKMSYLYSTFAQLVSVHCKATASTTALPVNQCKRDLLTYGYEKLQTFSDAQLDAFDPYQRGANELIWSSIMRDHSSSTLITTRKPQPLPTVPASSIIILTHQKPSKTATPVYTSPSTPAATTQQQYPNNPLFETDADHKHKYAMDMDIAYGFTGVPPMHSQVETFESSPSKQQEKTYLTGGPLVFRVRPDGTPVEEDQYRPYPSDDDLETFQAISTASDSNGQKETNTNGAHSHKHHHKIATISALKQQRLATLALQRELQPPFEQPRVRRQFQLINHPITMQQFAGYHYEPAQA